MVAAWEVEAEVVDWRGKETPPGGGGEDGGAGGGGDGATWIETPSRGDSTCVASVPNAFTAAETFTDRAEMSSLTEMMVAACGETMVVRMRTLAV